MVLVGVVTCLAPSATPFALNAYHNYTAVGMLFKELENKYPDLAKRHSIGKSVQQRELYVLQVSTAVKVSFSTERFLRELGLMALVRPVYFTTFDICTFFSDWREAFGPAYV